MRILRWMRKTACPMQSMSDLAIDDAASRERASEPWRSVLLQAPAGSGKTTVLTERVLRLLAQVEQPEDILAITFTRKAAAEMRSRLLRALRGEIDTNTAQGRRLEHFAQAALERSGVRGWNLLQDPGRLRIQTIDSFNFRLASQLTIAAGAGGTLCLSDRPVELYRRAAQNALAAAHEDAALARDVDLLFDRLDNNWRNVANLLADMLRRRGHWLRYVLSHEPDALCARIGRSLEDMVGDQLAEARKRFSADLLAQAQRQPGVGELGTEPRHLRAWKRLAELSLLKSGDWRRAVNRTLGEEFGDKSVCAALRELIDTLALVDSMKESLEEIVALPQVPLSAADSAAIAALSRVLRAAAVHLQAEFAEAGRVDHTYVAGAARAALTEAGQPTDLALRTGLALRHILVDEFQDTSLAQFDLLEALTAGWEPGDGRTLFVVGDPMQSIYQFREAEVGLFLRARDHGVGGVALEPLRLTRNFRSVPRVIEWVNDTFAARFPVADDLRASAVAFTRSLPSSTEPGGEVSLRLFADTDREAETASIVERIAHLRAGGPEDDIAILVASRAHAAPIMTALEDRHIEAVGVDLVPLQELPIVRDLVALLQATDHLGDRTAWLTVLRAPWCGVSLATLTAVSTRDDAQLARRDSRFVWETLHDAGRLADCTPEEQARLLRVRDVIAAALESRTSLPLAEWLERMWLQLGGADAYPGRDLRHARAFFAALSERVAGGEWQGAHDLGSMLAELYAEPLATGRHPVQIMTIHRAKGLEFDHVFLPCLDRDLSRNGEPLLRWLDLPRAQGESDLVMSPVPAIGADSGGDVGDYLKRLMNRRSANEQIRLLYVAATRARQTLHLSGAPVFNAEGVPAPRGRTLLKSLWPAFADRPGSWIDARRTSGEAAQATATRRVPFSRLTHDWSPAVLDSGPRLERLPLARQSLEPPEFSWVGETARHVGTVVHAALEGFGRLERLPEAAHINAQRDYFARELRRHGVPEHDLARATETVVEALRRTLGSERGRWIFAASHRSAFSELALTGLAQGRLTNVIVDRSFVDAGVRWVIDFKTSRHQGGGLEEFLSQELERYRPQLQTYVDLASALGPEPVRAALYFPLLEAFRELV